MVGGAMTREIKGHGPEIGLPETIIPLDTSTICPECGRDQHAPIVNGACIRCHDRRYERTGRRADDPRGRLA